MVVAQATGGAYALSLALLIAVIYLAVVRFMDVNEKEPLWAVGLLFAQSLFHIECARGVVYPQCPKQPRASSELTAESAPSVASNSASKTLALALLNRAFTFEKASSMGLKSGLYVSPDGVQILHIVTAWSSADVANAQIQPFGQELMSQGFEKVREFPLKNADGQQVGTAQILIGDGGEEVAIWTDDVLFCVVDAPKGYGADFFNELPY